MPRPSILRPFLRDASASLTTMSALVLPMLLGFAAFGVDLGSFYLDARRLKGAADLAVVAAASDMASAPERVGRILVANGFPDAAPALQFGVYVPDPARPADQRFVPAETGINAVRLAVEERSPAFFARLFRIEDFPIAAVSVAAVRPTASFALTSQLASLDDGIVNDVLEAVLGAGVSLDVLDNRRLASASLNAGRLADALVLATGPAATLAALLDRPVDGKVLFAAAATALRQAGEGPAAAVFDRLSRDVAAGRLSLKGADLIEVADAERIELGHPSPALDLDLNALDLLTASVTATAAHRTAVAVEHDLLGLASVSVEILLGEAGKSTPLLAVDGVGTTLDTAQLRVRLRLRAGAAGGLLGLGSIELPLQLLAASGTARLTAVECGGPASAHRATLAVTPGLAGAAVGRFDGPLAGAALADRPAPARIAGLSGVAEVRALARIAMADPKPSAVSFDRSDIRSGRVKTVRTARFLGSLASSLFDGLDLKVTLLRAPLLPVLTPGSRSEIERAAAALLAGLAAPLDGALNGLTALLGVGLGEAHVRVADVRCGGARLVF